MEKWLGYNDISLIPTLVSTLEHRAEADTSVQFGSLKLKVPIIAAPMPDVTNGLMALTLQKCGSFGWAHRFQSIENQIEQLDLYDGQSLGNTGGAIGLNDDLRAETLYDYGVRMFCLDTANGASEMVYRALGTLKDKYHDIFIVTGNVSSWQAFRALESWGADAIRVGIAGGSVCETRTETGVYSPMASVILECAQRGHKIMYSPKEKEPNYALLIADGGIKTPSDMCKALALGADIVMMGGALAGTAESPGQVLKVDGKKYKILRGAASFSTQKETNGTEPDYVEGAETLIPYRGSVEKVISRFAAGLRSSMSYMNAKTLTEYRINAKIVEV